MDHPCRLRGLIVAGGSSDGSVIFYDNASAASGTALLTLGVNANTNETLNIPDQGSLLLMVYSQILLMSIV